MGPDGRTDGGARRGPHRGHTGVPDKATRGLDGVPDGGHRGPNGVPDGGHTGAGRGARRGPHGGHTRPHGVADKRIIYF
jgi:hypothetical protein